MASFASFLAVFARFPIVLVRPLSYNEPNNAFSYVQIASACFTREAVKYAVNSNGDEWAS